MSIEPEGGQPERGVVSTRDLRSSWLLAEDRSSDGGGPVDVDPTAAAVAASPPDQGGEISDREPGPFLRKLAGVLFVVISGGILVEIVVVTRMWGWGLSRSSFSAAQPGAPAFVLLTSLLFSVGILLVLWLRRPARFGPPLLALAGTALVAFNSGGMRPRTIESVGRGERASGDVIEFLDPGSAAIWLGAGLLGAAFVWWVVTWFVAGDERCFGPGLAVVWLSVVAVGTVLITNSESARVVGGWVEGRPMRRSRVWGERRSRGSDRAPRGVGDLWLEAAIDEHASITTFRDLASRLGAADAPATLIERCRAAAADEERHARMCDRLATRAGCSAVALARSRAQRRSVTWRTRRAVARSHNHELVSLAVESLVDGSLGEGFAALRLAEGSRKAQRSEDRVILRTMSRDERRHADLAEEIVRWCAVTGGFPVRLALRLAGTTTPRQTRAPESRVGFSRASLNEVGLMDQDQGQELWRCCRRASRDALGGQSPA